MQRLLTQHLIWISLSLILAFFLGSLLDHSLLIISITLAIWLIWYLYRVQQLLRRLKQGSIGESESPALWNELYAELAQEKQDVNTNINQLETDFSALLKATDEFSEPLLFIDSDNNLLQYNQQAAKILGLQSKHIGLPINILIHQPDFTHWLESKGLEADNLVIRSPVNENIMLRAQLIRYTQNQSLLVLTDITNIQLQSQIRQDFVANVSHELRTPLTVLNGYLEVLIADESDPNHPVFTKLYEQTISMNELVTDLLELARLQNESRKRKMITAVVDVPLLLEELYSTALELSSGQHSIDTQIDKSLLIPGKKRDLKSAFGNLIANAVRYTQAGGKISIRWSKRSGSAIFEVIDNGPGIKQQDIPRLTERFYRADSGRNRNQGGTGLGLAIVKHVVEKHHGRLEIESEPERSSSFRIILPLARI